MQPFSSLKITRPWLLSKKVAYTSNSLSLSPCVPLLGTVATVVTHDKGHVAPQCPGPSASSTLFGVHTYLKVLAMMNICDDWLLARFFFHAITFYWNTTRIYPSKVDMSAAPWAVVRLSWGKFRYWDSSYAAPMWYNQRRWMSHVKGIKVKESVIKPD